MPYSRLGLHFVGANGFPCAMYRPALKHIERLAKNSSIFSYAQPAITHTDVYDHVNHCVDWSGMVEAIASDIMKHHHGPIVGCGHSLGILA
jgi:hypothetical protein